MQHPLPSDFEARTNATYEALMWALSRPGLPRSLPIATEQIGQAYYQTSIIETLIDRECAVFSDDESLAQAASRAGAQIVPPEQADHLFLTRIPAPSLLMRLSQGSDLYPDDGATLVMPSTFADETGTSLKLTGPGVNGAVQITVAGVPDDLWETRAQIMRYPMGFEIFLIDGDQVIGLPRSTVIEVL